MNRLSRLFLMIAGCLLFLVVALPAYARTTPSFFPDHGDLWYDGYYFADSYFLWHNPGGWRTNDPGYEHDLSIRSHYFEDCTTWTNLPSGYDDCPTAGVSEPSDLWTFSFGSFHIKNAQPSTWYYGAWNFSGGWSMSTNWSLAGQENERYYCFWDNIWCMNSTQTQNLLSSNLGDFRWGEEAYLVYDFYD